MVHSMVLPLEAINFMVVTMLRAMYESRPEVGSSQNISGGFVNTWKSQLYSDLARKLWEPERQHPKLVMFCVFFIF